MENDDCLNLSSSEDVLSWVNQEYDRQSKRSTRSSVFFPDLESKSELESNADRLPTLNWTESQIDKGREVYKQRLMQNFLKKDQNPVLQGFSDVTFDQMVQKYQEQVSIILADYLSICRFLCSSRDRKVYLQSCCLESEWLSEIELMNEEGPLKYVMMLRKKVIFYLKEGRQKGLVLDQIYYALPSHLKLFWPNIQTLRTAFSGFLQH